MADIIITARKIAQEEVLSEEEALDLRHYRPFIAPQEREEPYRTFAIA